MDTFVSGFLFSVSFGLLLVLCLGGTINRYRRDDDPPTNLSEAIPDIFNTNEMKKVFDDIEKSVAAQMKQFNKLHKVLDQYPDKYNKTFSKTENINGKDIVTNTTILKDKTGHSNAQMFIQQRTVGGNATAKGTLGGGLMILPSEQKIIKALLNDTVKS